MAEIDTPVGAAPVIPLVLLFGGFYLTWFGVHYWRDRNVKWPTDPIKGLLTGKGLPTVTRNASLSSVPTTETAGLNTGTSVGGGPNAAIAQTAVKYEGAGYQWGGNADAVGNWDCSSFVSYVLGHDLGLPLPGGRWDGPGMPPKTHGPTTVSYMLYGTPIERKDVSAGDLVVWPTHIGIAIDNTSIVSARGKDEGTGVSSIDGTTSSLGELPSFRRVSNGGVLV